MDKYIRKPAVFNKGSKREMKIWDWILQETNNFQDIGFSAFVRDNLELCMKGESNPSPELQNKKSGWSNFT